MRDLDSQSGYLHQARAHSGEKSGEKVADSGGLEGHRFGDFPANMGGPFPRFPLLPLQKWFESNRAYHKRIYIDQLLT
jgi:hypothetical protein